MMLDLARDRRIYSDLLNSHLVYSCLYGGEISSELEVSAPHLVPWKLLRHDPPPWRTVYCYLCYWVMAAATERGSGIHDNSNMRIGQREASSNAHGAARGALIYNAICGWKGYGVTSARSWW
jgi:hypothetical protein